MTSIWHCMACTALPSPLGWHPGTKVRPTLLAVSTEDVDILSNWEQMRAAYPTILSFLYTQDVGTLSMGEYEHAHERFLSHTPFFVYTRRGHAIEKDGTVILIMRTERTGSRPRECKELPGLTVVPSGAQGCILPPIFQASNRGQLRVDVSRSSTGRPQGMGQSSFNSWAGLAFTSEWELVVTR